eukprot:gnl/Hemi2/9576_TR3321_c0_g1_i1.p1 gnl/Hemi2/9576_TR3321_c0_g1~~gnl/Hemi2/9576_TR3321_c0_g1_i1.p1  ORF type:complete len:209 (+),score=30.46 gnl/Hemi2/9576_TR3321_c0_g1_i1:120-746(+)
MESAPATADADQEQGESDESEDDDFDDYPHPLAAPLLPQSSTTTTTTSNSNVLSSNRTLVAGVRRDLDASASTASSAPAALAPGRASSFYSHDERSRSISGAGQFSDRRPDESEEEAAALRKRLQEADQPFSRRRKLCVLVILCAIGSICAIVGPVLLFTIGEFWRGVGVCILAAMTLTPGLYMAVMYYRKWKRQKLKARQRGATELV